MLKEIIENHPNWLKFFKEELHPAPKEEYLVEVVEVLLGKRETIEQELTDFNFKEEDKQYIFNVINHIVVREDVDTIFRIVKPDNLLINLHLLLDKAIDHSNPSILGKICAVLIRFCDLDVIWYVFFFHL